jgi:hypothetical protein
MCGSGAHVYMQTVAGNGAHVYMQTVAGSGAHVYMQTVAGSGAHVYMQTCWEWSTCLHAGLQGVEHMSTCRLCGSGAPVYMWEWITCLHADLLGVEHMSTCVGVDHMFTCRLLLHYIEIYQRDFEAFSRPFKIAKIY